MIPPSHFSAMLRHLPTIAAVARSSPPHRQFANAARNAYRFVNITDKDQTNVRGNFCGNLTFSLSQTERPRLSDLSLFISLRHIPKYSRGDAARTTHEKCAQVYFPGILFSHLWTGRPAIYYLLSIYMRFCRLHLSSSSPAPHRPPRLLCSYIAQPTPSTYIYIASESRVSRASPAASEIINPCGIVCSLLCGANPLRF